MPEETSFAPQTIHEIGKIAWYSLESVTPSSQTQDSLIPKSKFFIVFPFTLRLRDWLRTKSGEKQKRGVSSSLNTLKTTTLPPQNITMMPQSTIPSPLLPFRQSPSSRGVDRLTSLFQRAQLQRHHRKDVTNSTHNKAIQLNHERNKQTSLLREFSQAKELEVKEKTSHIFSSIRPLSQTIENSAPVEVSSSQKEQKISPSEFPFTEPRTTSAKDKAELTAFLREHLKTANKQPPSPIPMTYQGDSKSNGMQTGLSSKEITQNLSSSSQHDNNRGQVPARSSQDIHQTPKMTLMEPKKSSPLPFVSPEMVPTKILLQKGRRRSTALAAEASH